MSIEKHIATLERLATLDAAIKELTDSIAKWQGELNGVKVELAGLDERLQGDRNSVGEMDKTRADLHQEMRQIAGQIDRSRERLQRSRNEREANAAERELEELRKIQRDRDEEIKKLQDLGEQARASMTEGELRRKELEERLAGSLEGTQKTIADLETDLAAQRAQRAEVTKLLPSTVFRRYERLHTRGKVPIAKTHDGTCLGCFVQLPPMMFHTMLSRQSFEECPNCHRIIYYEPPLSPEEKMKAEEEKAAKLKASEEAKASAAEPAAPVSEGGVSGLGGHEASS